ncbi:sensor histidine kinase [Runella rosea]|nr:sensor histidine kinase [Runella rosea]
MTRLNDRWLRIIGITLLMLMSVSVNNYLQMPFSWTVAGRLMLTMTSIVATWHLNRFVIFKFREQYPLGSQIIKRLVLTFLTGMLGTTLVLWLTGIARHWLIYQTLDDSMIQHYVTFTINNHRLSLWFYGVDFVKAAIMFLLFLPVYEALFFAVESREIKNRLQQSEREKEALEKTNLQSQLEALKQQVNPHFLFNSLNALGTLIEEDPPQASLFLEELSTVYRYLLRSNEQNLTTLGAELDFIHSYTHLLKTRYGAGLKITIHVDSVHEAFLLPPLTLQLLVENAVKHNIILPEQPLSISIFTNSDNQLVITNNLQRKNTKIHSNGLGLNNILTKYKMLGQTVPTILENESQFSVRLPLIRYN